MIGTLVGDQVPPEYEVAGRTGQQRLSSRRHPLVDDERADEAGVHRDPAGDRQERQQRQRPSERRPAMPARPEDFAFWLPVASPARSFCARSRGSRSLPAFRAGTAPMATAALACVARPSATRWCDPPIASHRQVAYGFSDEPDRVPTAWPRHRSLPRLRTPGTSVRHRSARPSPAVVLAARPPLRPSSHRPSLSTVHRTRHMANTAYAKAPGANVSRFLVANLTPVSHRGCHELAPR